MNPIREDPNKVNWTMKKPAPYFNECGCQKGNIQFKKR